MKTGNLNFTRSFYVLDCINDDQTKRDYLLKQKSVITGPILTERVRIEEDNGYHEQSRFFEHWIYFRNDTNWKRCLRSGLGFTNFENIFEGNISQRIDLNNNSYNVKELENPKHFIIVQFSSDKTILIVDIFKDFYPYKKGLIDKIINEHNFVYQKQERKKKSV